jgi:hypothetical protein
MQWRLENYEPAISAISKRHCPRCRSRIAAFSGSGTIECAICDFADATMILSDAIIATSFRLLESANRVEIVLSHF